MHILVTGGAGFIGSHAVERLLSDNHSVVCLDNFNDFYDPDLKRRNIGRAMACSRYKLVTGDILDRELLDKLFAERFDAVLHLAAHAGVRPSIEQPELYQRVNIEGTLNLLERCREHETEKFVFASSSSVYGGRTNAPFRETDDVTRPISPYAATKLAGEVLCHTYHYLFDLNVFVLRFFTVYGPRQRPEMAIHLFANHVRDGEPITVFGDGRASRDYTYVSDIVDGIAAALERCSGYEIINLGGSVTISLNDLIELIGRELQREPKTRHLPDQPGDVPLTCADIARATEVLDYEPRVRIDRGIELFCDWLEDHERSRE